MFIDGTGFLCYNLFVKILMEIGAYSLYKERAELRTNCPEVAEQNAARG